MKKNRSYQQQQRALRELLREIREENGLLQQQVAERLGCAQSFVSKYESGERTLDLIEVRQIAKTLGTTLNDVTKRLERRI